MSIVREILRGVECLTTLEHEDQFVEETQHLGGVRTRDRDLVALARGFWNRGRPFDDAQVLVTGSEQSAIRWVFGTEVVAVRASWAVASKVIRWPLHSSSAEDMHVEVRHGHLRVGPTLRPVDNHFATLRVRRPLGPAAEVIDDAPWPEAISSALVMWASR